MDHGERKKREPPDLELPPVSKRTALSTSLPPINDDSDPKVCHVQLIYNISFQKSL